MNGLQEPEANNVQVLSHKAKTATQKKKGSLKCRKKWGDNHIKHTQRISVVHFLLDTKDIRNSLLLLIYEFKLWDPKRMAEKESITSWKRGRREQQKNRRYEK